MADTGRMPQQTGQGAGQQAKETAGFGQKAMDVASNVAGKAQDVASGVAQRAGEAVSAVGSGMSSLAGTLREHAPQSGVLGSAASTVAGGLQTGGDYLQSHSMGDVMDDLAHVIRRHPIPALLVGFGVGFMLARVTSRG